ncbi:uncharacterized protein LOC111366706 [Olea europaea var. sylvestris]|uniref:uncharacterized protein LOC111366706 n=1 Tax=Olea europaea var. sylvestris TaxID=158386 RepID=UPI000C1D4EE3|nr:uncharacterized protein LOC111366706 [Olea europaea var. sylvestris]
MEGLNHVASAVGRPLHTDAIILTRKCPSFSRVCIEINAVEVLVEDFDFCHANGEWITICAEFEWIPIKCTECGVFYHSCTSHTKPRKKLSKVWVAKDKAGQSGVANDKPPIDNGWTHVSHKRKSSRSVDDGIAIPIQVDGIHTLADNSKRVVLKPNENTELGEEGKVSPVSLAILNEEDSHTSIPHSNSLAKKAIDSLQKKKNGPGEGQMTLLKNLKIWICWNPNDVHVLLVGSLAQAIHVHVNVCNGKCSSIVSVVYGDNVPVKRGNLWVDLVARHGGFTCFPWLVMGDFNSVISLSDVAGNSSSWHAWKDDLRNCMATAGLDDLKFDNCLYTWSNKYVFDPILKKLDWVLVNLEREEEFQGSEATFVSASVSDHFPMIRGEAVVGTPIYFLCLKLKKLKLALKDFNKEHFSNLPTLPLDSSLYNEEVQLQKEFFELSKANEGFLRQKARVKWPNLGDQNTAFFFKAMKSHYGKNKVVSICREDGTRVEEPYETSQVIVEFYQNLLGQQPSGERLDIDLLQKALPKNILMVQKESLDRDVLFDKIKEVLFLQEDLEHCGEWFSTCNKSFFDSSNLLKQVNATTIALVPKIPNPSQVKDFRPISCCNIIYKCVAKLIANRVKMVLPDIVGPQQIAFVKGRHIIDNILFSQELLRNYHRGGGLHRSALKVDLMKAYDFVH